MIANIVLGMLLVWFTCVLVITIRAGADRREQDALGSSHAHPRLAAKDDVVAPALTSVEVVAAQPEATEVITASLTL